MSINKTVSPYHCLKIFKFSIQFLKVTFHLHLLQNISYISHVVEYILEPILRPVVCLSYSITLILPLPTFPVITTSLLSISVRLLLFLLCSLGWFLGFFFFLVPHISDSMWWQSFSIWLISLSLMPSKAIHAAANGKISFFFQRPSSIYCVYVHTHFLLEKKMTTHSSIFAWESPWTEEPGGLQTMGLQRVRHNLATKQQQHRHIL